MQQILIENSILLLFLVISFGAFLGNLKIKGKSLGVSTVLFVGLFIGYLNPKFHIPPIILILGISIFIYSIGLNSGPVFFESYKKNGFRDFSFSFSMLLITGLFAALIWLVFDFSAASISGIYAGISTNTPAFATVLDYIQNTDQPASAKDDLVVAYTLSYPIGVFVSMLAIIIMEKLLKIDYQAEYDQLRTVYQLDNDLTTAAVEITNQAICNAPMRDLFINYDWNIKFGRVLSEGKLSLPNWDTHLKIGDQVMIVGSKEDLEKAIDLLGKPLKDKLSYDSTEFHSRRIFMSNPKLAGKTVASLNISENYNAMITRIRRGDNDMLAHSNTVLELGDRIRFIAKREELRKLSKYFGDSYQASSSINLFTFGLGLSLGLLLGSVNFPISGDLSVKLGFAGGPLIVGLVLGALRRTGPLLWTLPFSASVVLQQLGLMFILVYVGVNNGAIFFESLNVQSLGILGASTFLSLISGMIILFVGYKIVKLPFALLMGMVSNQPAVLEFSNQKAGSKIPQLGFALILPIALIMKILIAQLLFIILS